MKKFFQIIGTALKILVGIFCFLCSVAFALAFLGFVITAFMERQATFSLTALISAGLAFLLWKVGVLLLKKKEAEATKSASLIENSANAVCRKCGTALTGRYCIACGHDSKEPPAASQPEIPAPAQDAPANASLEDFPIPEVIRNLLWFKNGAAYNLPNSENEPSTIDANLPISYTTGLWKMVDLGYYPSYAQLSPEQRAVYLEWLNDIRDPVPIGYVFLFYYGLERYLFTDKCSDAAGAILALRHSHENNSFRHYSADALAIYAVAQKKHELFESLKADLSDTVYLWARTELDGYLLPIDLIHTHRSWGFTNTRYLHGEDGISDLYYNALVEVVTAHYGQDMIPLNDVPRNRTAILVLANYSLPQTVREHRIPDITASPAFAAQMQGLLAEAHERVKVQLRELRKIQQPKKE